MTIIPINIRVKVQNILKLKAFLLLKFTVTRTERNTNILVIVARVIIILERRNTSLMKRFMGSSKILNHQLLMEKLKKERKPKHGYLE